jgi:division protein CdvB (Snf7/Vps24/ESCRT-III family)
MMVPNGLITGTAATATRLEARLRRRLERGSTRLLHRYNVPTAGDISSMRSQLAAVEARLRAMDARLQEEQHEKAESTPA